MRKAERRRQAINSATLRPKTAVILGTASCVFDDIDQLNNLIHNREDYIVLSVNFATILPVKPNYIVGIHGDYIDTYKAVAQIKAEEFGWAKDFYTVSYTGHADYVYPELESEGTSGRFAISVALEKLNCTKIILCGIPIDGTKRFYGDIRHDYAKIKDNQIWERIDPTKVRSFSGNTLKRYGAPTLEWLQTH